MLTKLSEDIKKKGVDVKSFLVILNGSDFINADVSFQKNLKDTVYVIVT